MILRGLPSGSVRSLCRGRGMAPSKRGTDESQIVDYCGSEDARATAPPGVEKQTPATVGRTNRSVVARNGGSPFC